MFYLLTSLKKYIVYGFLIMLCNFFIFLKYISSVHPQEQIDGDLSSLAGRLSSAAYTVRKVRQLTDINTVLLVCFIIHHIILAWEILVWGNAADIESIFIFQKGAVSAIYSVGARESHQIVLIMLANLH